MPLDPILANPASLKLDNPLEQYGNYLNNAMLMDKNRASRRAEEVRNAMSGFYQQGEGDREKIAQLAIRGGYGVELQDQKKGWFEQDKTLAETADKQAGTLKAEAETLEQGLKNFQFKLVGVKTPEQYMAVINNDAVVGPYLSKRYSDPNKFLAALKQMPPEEFQKFVFAQTVGPDKSNENTLTHANTGEGVKFMQGKKYGDTPLTQVASFKSPPTGIGTKVDVNLPGAPVVNAFEDAVGKGRGERFLEVEKAAGQNEVVIGEINRALNILGTGNVILGAGSPIMIDLVRGAKALGFSVNDERLANSEELSRFFAQNTLANFARFKEMGVSLTPMSNADRELIERASAQGTNDPATIRRLLIIQRNAAQDSIAKFKELEAMYTRNKGTAPGMNAIGSVPVQQWPTPSTSHINALRKNPQRAGDFENKFGPGSAARALSGGTPNGGVPFPVEEGGR